MVKTGLEIFLNRFPSKLVGKKIGVLCHAPSITRDFVHITEHLHQLKTCSLAAIFGPQHGLSGETQDNMIEWAGRMHPVYNVPVYSLYGEHRKPTPKMLADIDALIIDIQDVGARLYTYIWTVKLCMEACTEAGIPLWILDRPNPVGGLGFDGPVLKEEFFTFVGGASIPLCHRMTAGEIALWIKDKYYWNCDLTVIRMEGWNRNMMYDSTGLPWVLPSPNMPTPVTAIVYPGIVLFEALNLSEGRGTTIPFELFGAPYIDPYKLLENLRSRKLEGCSFRIHNFIPTFNKYMDQLCGGLQIHVNDIQSFRPVCTALEIIEAVVQTTVDGKLVFNPPPYEYEYNLMPFDILSGDQGMRETIEKKGSLFTEIERWKDETASFKKEFTRLAIYSD